MWTIYISTRRVKATALAQSQVVPKIEIDEDSLRERIEFDDTPLRERIASLEAELDANNEEFDRLREQLTANSKVTFTHVLGEPAIDEGQGQRHCRRGRRPEATWARSARPGTLEVPAPWSPTVKPMTIGRTIAQTRSRRLQQEVELWKRKAADQSTGAQEAPDQVKQAADDESPAWKVIVWCCA